jgi:hypothetical protein
MKGSYGDVANNDAARRPQQVLPNCYETGTELLPFDYG